MLVGVLALAGTGAAAGPGDRDDRGIVRPNTGANVFDDGDGAPAYSTAEEVLRALQKSRPANEVIPGGSATPASRYENPAPLYPEGWSLVRRGGHLVSEGGQWVFVFDDAKGEPPLALLPNATLEGMIRESAGASGEFRFLVSGEITVFRGRNYLLPRVAMHAAAPPAGHVDTPREERLAPEQAEPSATAEAEPSAEDVLALLSRQTPGERMVSAVDAAPADHDGQSRSGSSSLLPDGTPLVDRPGRLIASGTSWTFVLESDSIDFAEPPMKLLANQNAELMIRASEQGKNGLVFLVSGEVTVFEGENYLLPRTVMRRIDSGNLRN